MPTWISSSRRKYPMRSEQSMEGHRLYVFKNTLRSDLKVPTQTDSGERRVAPGEEFTGDHSLMRLVRFGMASLVREITSQGQEQVVMDRFLNKVFHGDALRLLQA